MAIQQPMPQAIPGNGAIADPREANFLQWLKQTNPQFNPAQYSSAQGMNQLYQLVNTPTNDQNVTQKMMAGLMRPPPGRL